MWICDVCIAMFMKIEYERDHLRGTPPSSDYQAPQPEHIMTLQLQTWGKD